MRNLFFELLQLALGTRQTLSFTPSEKEWIDAFDVSKKQALVGICFKGVQQACRLDGDAAKNLPVQLKMQWLALTANIQKRNEVMNLRCAELYGKIKADGYESCVLKGQAVAKLYDKEHEAFGQLRQSGDIDMWMLADADTAIRWAKETDMMYYFDYHHADLSLFPDAEIELHYRPSISRNLWRNHRLQRWFKDEGKKHITHDEELGFCVPDEVFSLMLTLNHNLWHLLYEGVGLRQMMDLYFVAKAMHSSEDTTRLIHYFGLERFAAASAWVLWHLFDNELQQSFLISSKSPLPYPNESAGRFLLREIMQAGNFGHNDDRLAGLVKGNRIVLMYRWLRHTMRLVRYYPQEVMWTPFGILRISLWRRWKVRKYSLSTQ